MMNENDKKAIEEFNDAVNMTATEISDWLENENSQKVVARCDALGAGSTPGANC